MTCTDLTLRSTSRAGLIQRSKVQQSMDSPGGDQACLSLETMLLENHLSKLAQACSIYMTDQTWSRRSQILATVEKQKDSFHSQCSGWPEDFDCTRPTRGDDYVRVWQTMEIPPGRYVKAIASSRHSNSKPVQLCPLFFAL